MKQIEYLSYAQNQTLWQIRKEFQIFWHIYTFRQLSIDSLKQQQQIRGHSNNGGMSGITHTNSILETWPENQASVGPPCQLSTWQSGKKAPATRKQASGRNVYRSSLQVCPRREEVGGKRHAMLRNLYIMLFFVVTACVLVKVRESLVSYHFLTMVCIVNRHLT